MSKIRQDKRYCLEEFECRRCGNCCKGDGIVILSEAEVAAAAKVLGIRTDEFLPRFTIESEFGERWLVDKFVDDERWCVFLERNEEGLFGCMVQSAKPEQCRNFPFKWRTRDMLGDCQGMKG